MAARSVVPANLLQLGEAYAAVCSAHIQYRRLHNLACMIRYLLIGTVASGVVLSALLMSTMNMSTLCLVQAIIAGAVYQLLYDDIDTILQCSNASAVIYKEVLSHFQHNITDQFVIRITRELHDLTPVQIDALRGVYPHQKHEIPLTDYQELMGYVFELFTDGSMATNQRRDIIETAEELAHRRIQAKNNGAVTIL